MEWRDPNRDHAARFSWYGADVWIPETPGREVATGYAGMPARWFLLGRLKRVYRRRKAAADATVIANHLAKIRPQIYPAHFSKCQLRHWVIRS